MASFFDQPSSLSEQSRDVRARGSPPGGKPVKDIESLTEEYSVGTGAFSGFEHHPSLRLAFLRRVYAILSLQLLTTAFVSMACMFNSTLREFTIANASVITWGSFIPCIITLLVLGCVKKEYPLNIILLSVFTMLQSLVVGSICAAFYANGLGDAVAQAAVLTALVFVGLTAYCFISKKDFSFLGGFLFTCLILMIGWGFLNLLFGWQARYIYSALGALLFCGYILFDTYQISQRYELDDYIAACIELYLDIINLFLYILRLLAERRE